jgi:mono/diheme cytochrome c family protein
MRKWTIAAILALALASAGAASLGSWPISTDPDLGDLKGDPQRGAYLARIGGCIACHTDSENGGQPLAGGVELKTGFGTFYSPNLTTDREHGIGEWTISDFAKAVRQGASPDGRPYYPAFPYPFYAVLSDQDIADLWAAFRTVPPVAEPSRDQELTFPFSFRPALKLWRALYFDRDPLQPAPDRSDLWKRGRFIAEGPGHCAACHTPRNFLGAREDELHLEGADGLPNGGTSPPIQAEALEEEGWTQGDLKYALQTGIMPDGDAFGGAMGEVVREGTRFMTDRDLEALAAYLMDEDEYDD